MLQEAKQRSEREANLCSRAFQRVNGDKNLLVLEIQGSGTNNGGLRIIFMPLA